MGASREKCLWWLQRARALELTAVSATVSGKIAARGRGDGISGKTVLSRLLPRVQVWLHVYMASNTPV